MKVLITGICGFVGTHLRAEFERAGWQVVGTDLKGEGVLPADLLDQRAVETLLSEVRPDAVVHLAGQASVQLSWKIPRKTFDINVGCTINLLEALHKLGQTPRVLVIGSSDEYGIVRAEDCPIRETMALRPKSPYAVSKAAQEMTAQALSQAFGLEVLCTRSFNHIGVGQRRGFVVPDFASAIAEIEAGRSEPVLRVGNLEARRDFTDVRDIVRAYRLLVEKGRAGEVYNIGSGRPRSIHEILDRLLKLSRVPVKVEQDPARMRVSDIPLISCCAEKLRADTGWEPKVPVDQTLLDILEDFRRRA